MIYSSLTIFEIEVVNTENKCCLESTTLTYPWPCQYFYSVPLQINSTAVYFFLHFYSLNDAIVYSSLPAPFSCELFAKLPRSEWW